MQKRKIAVQQQYLVEIRLESRAVQQLLEQMLVWPARWLLPLKNGKPKLVTAVSVCSIAADGQYTDAHADDESDKDDW